MEEIFEKYAALKEEYPDAVAQIEEEERRVSELLQLQDYSQQPGTQQLMAMCRKDLIAARKVLGTNRNLSEQARADLWLIIDARSWFLQMVDKDYEAQLAQIEQQLEADLSV